MMNKDIIKKKLYDINSYRKSLEDRILSMQEEIEELAESYMYKEKYIESEAIKLATVNKIQEYFMDIFYILETQNDAIKFLTTNTGEDDYEDKNEDEDDNESPKNKIEVLFVVAHEWYEDTNTFTDYTIYKNFDEAYNVWNAQIPDCGLLYIYNINLDTQNQCNYFITYDKESTYEEFSRNVKKEYGWLNFVEFEMPNNIIYIVENRSIELDEIENIYAYVDINIAIKNLFTVLSYYDDTTEAKAEMCVYEIGAPTLKTEKSRLIVKYDDNNKIIFTVWGNDETYNKILTDAIENYIKMEYKNE